MVEIKPFPAVVFNFNKLKQPHKVICPPYDIISPLKANAYRNLSPHNMVHLTLPEDALGCDRYQVASNLFNDWLDKGILSRSKDPAIYFYQQEYRINKRKFKRLGFIACLGLKGSPAIYGHEHTHIEPKEDRFKLLVKVKANLEPIFVLFSDRRGFLQRLLKRYVISVKPFIYFRDQEGNINTVWKLTEPAMLKKISAKMADKKFFIADGHHRYEVSLNYQELMGESGNIHNKDFNYIMAYFCPIQSRGLVIRPVHRLLKHTRALPMEEFKKFFYIQKTTQRKLFHLMRLRTRTRRIIGMYFNKKFYSLILKDNKIINKIDKHYRHLDICLLNYLILERLLQVNPGDKQRLIFSANTQDLIDQADFDKTSLLFFVEPVKISDIIGLARQGKKMPVKTTYFYPKVPSGLVIYRFSD